jgi:aspartyl/asparaginyl-tRNA synthetase
VEKCNAVSIVITYFGEYDPSFIKGRLLSVWDNLASGGLVNAYRHIKSYEDIEALKYLTDCALGLKSVTIGDSQVMSQVCDALQEADAIQQQGFRLFPTIIAFIKRVMAEVKADTNLYDGNTSLERIATEVIKKDISTSSSVTVLGAGKTGSLIVKILSAEYKIKTLLTNRSAKRRDALVSKYSGVTGVDFDDTEKLAKSAYIVVTIPNTEKTQEYVSKLLAITNDRAVIVDLSSPSITNSIKVPNPTRVINVEKLSTIANERLAARKSDVDKVQSMIRKQLIGYAQLINKDVAKYCTDKRKQAVSLKLDETALNLLKIRNACNKAVRDLYDEKGFLEITTPYIVGVSSDPPRVDNGGVFTVDWPDGGTAFLRQSNQLYKQMIVASGMDNIFEIGPFWRAEESTTYRHLLESIGLDVEFASPKGLEAVYGLAYTTILAADKAITEVANMKKSTLTLPPLPKVPVLTYGECVLLLRSKGYDIKYGQDLGLTSEYRLGAIIKKERKSDALIITNYPDTIKKFYTMKRENGETETFDIIIDGWELVSGALRNTKREQIEKSMMLSGVNTGDYSFYLSVVSDAVPHGGFCLGLDRMIAKSMDLEIVSETSPFPRTAESLIP